MLLDVVIQVMTHLPVCDALRFGQYNTGGVEQDGINLPRELLELCRAHVEEHVLDKLPVQDDFVDAVR